MRASQRQAGPADVDGVGGAMGGLPAPPASERLDYLRDVLAPRPQQRDECGQRERYRAPCRHHEMGHDGPPYHVAVAVYARHTTTDDHR